MNKYLAKEIIKRYLDEKKIEEIILEKYTLGTKLKAPRDELHQYVGQKLNVNVNVPLIKRINRYFERVGVRRVKNRGRRYYRGIG